MTDVPSVLPGEIAGISPSSAAGPAPATVVVCTTCRLDGAPEGAALLAATRAAAGDGPVAVAGVACLGNCRAGLSAAVVAPGAWSYVFGGLAAGNAADLVAGAGLLAQSGDGTMPWRGRPEALKRGLVARIPSFPAIAEGL